MVSYLLHSIFPFETYSVQIRNHVYQEEESHRSEQERMKTEISDLTEELHRQEITIATIMEKAGLLERQLKTELEIKDKLLAKQQVCKQAKPAWIILLHTIDHDIHCL